MIACALAALAAAADLKPIDAKLGLWETTTTTETQGMPAMPDMPQIPKETLDKIPAAQRAKMEEAIKQRSLGAPRTTTSKACHTKDTVNYEMPERRAGDCKREVITSTSSKLQMHFVCTSTGGGGVTDVMVDRIDSEHVKSTAVSKVDFSGKPITTKMVANSRWVSPDCGEVRPVIAK